MRKTHCTLRGLILATAIIVLSALPGAVSADIPNDMNAVDYSNRLGLEEIGAGATPTLGKMSIPEYRARQAIVQSSPVSLDIDLNPIQ